MSQTCTTCQKPKATLHCGLCDAVICKYCAQMTDEETFAFLSPLPKSLAWGTYCPGCFDAHVAPEIAAYQNTLAQAKEVLVYFKKQGKETRLVKRTERPVHVKDCPDYDEAILRLAFFAARAGFNSVVDVDMKSEKVHQGSYQTLKWSASGVPAHVEVSKLPKDRSLWQNPN